MTEAEYLVCTDPAKMLAHLRREAFDIRAPITDAQLRRFVEACREVAEDRGAYDLDSQLQAAVEFWSGTHSKLAPETSAVILRDICGSPWRPVKVIGGIVLPGPSWDGSTTTWIENPWLTPTVLALARAAHLEWVTRKCEACDGHGNTWNHRGKHAAYCSACNRTGTIPTAQLDRDRLLVLSDALSEAGCESEEILGHLRSAEAHYRGCWCLSLLLGKD